MNDRDWLLDVRVNKRHGPNELESSHADAYHRVN